MPITKTYMCPECAHRMEVTLSADQWDAPPPSCEACDAREMDQEFKPFGIGGSVASRAHKITEDIIARDYGVSNIRSDKGIGAVPQVSYKDQTADMKSAWQSAGGHRSMLETAISIGKANRGNDGLDILQRNLRDGTQVDLIEASKKRSIKVY